MKEIKGVLNIEERNTASPPIRVSISADREGRLYYTVLDRKSVV